MSNVQILSAIFTLAMFFFILPRAIKMVKNSPKGTMEDWMGFIIPIAAVVGFIFLLIAII